MTQSGVTLLLIVLILIVVTLWCIWWQWEYRNNTFIRAQREISRATGESDPYASTRLLMLGSDEDHHTLCRGWGLTDGVEYWFGRWWFDSRCAVLCVPQTLQTLQTTTTKHLIRQNEWQKTLAALVRSRPRRPLDGLVITLPLDALLPGAEETPLTASLLRNCQQIQQICGLSLPIYLLISGLETLEGTPALLKWLPDDATQSPIGSAIPAVREAVWKARWIDDALENTRFALRQAILEMGVEQGNIPPALFRLPEQLLDTAPALHQLFDPLLSSNARDEPPQLRGIWFTARQSTANPPHMAFSQKLLEGKILAEEGLALPVRRLLRLNMRRHFITLACYSCLFIVWLAAMFYTWKHQHNDGLLLHDRLLLLANQTGGNTPGERSAALYWRTLNGIPRWQFQSVVWPGSLFSQTDARLRDTFHRATIASLLMPAVNNICLQSQTALRGENIRERDNFLPNERYRQITQLLAGTKQMESRYLPLLQLLQVKQPTAKTLAAVSSSVWGVEVDPASLPRPTALNALFASLKVTQLNLPDATTLMQRNSELYARNTRLWLEQSYDSANLDIWLGQLEQLLTQFSASSNIDAVFVRTLVRQISRLQSTLANINNLSHDAAHSAISLQLNELLETAAPLKLIDGKETHALRQYNELLRQRLLVQLDDSPLHFTSLTEQTPDGNFAVSADLLALQKSLRDLLTQPFWQQGAGVVPTTNRGYPGNGQLRQALALYGGYQRFMQPLPDSLWQPKINTLATNAVENAMIQALYHPSSSSLPVAPVSTASADQVIEAFNQLHRPALANALRQQVATQVIADVRREGGALLPASHSVPGVNYASPQQTGQHVAAWANSQTEQISSAVIRYQPDIAWLDKQRPWLSAQDNQLVGRWQASLTAMQRSQQQDPGSPPAQMNALATALSGFTAENCQAQLAEYPPPAGQDFYSQSLNTLLNDARLQCQSQRQQASAGTVQQIFALYNEWLAGHFPFTPSLSARDADPDRVRALTRLLAQLPPESHEDQPLLIRQLMATQPLLSALLSPQGVTVRVVWRTSRLQEKGAEQIARWQLATAKQTRQYPGSETQDLHWRSGDGLRFSLRWATHSPWRPVAGTPQPGVTVSNDTALWRWQGPWALLRMIGSQRVGSESALQTPLRFSLPASDGRQQMRATVYLQLALLDPEGKTPLPWGALFKEHIDE